jgi:hypothetical protein
MWTKPISLLGGITVGATLAVTLLISHVSQARRLTAQLAGRDQKNRQKVENQLQLRYAFATIMYWSEVSSLKNWLLVSGL